MTAQISDEVIYRGKPYSIAGINGSGLFDPTQHGLRPVMFSTACWRGFHCTYEVADDALLLTRLNVGLDKEDWALAERGEGPKLFGQVPRRYTIHGYSVSGKGQVATRWESSDFRYDGLRAAVPFTGGLLLADDFIDELYVHMGFHPAWKFREVHELLFERGRVVKESDRSAAMAEFREMVQGLPQGPTDPEDHEVVERWVERCFSREYRW